MGKGSKIPASYGNAFKIAADANRYPPESPRFRVRLEHQPDSRTAPNGDTQPIQIDARQSPRSE